MENILELLGKPEKFLDKIFLNLSRDNIDVNDLELDHICFRVANEERYFYLKDKLKDFSEIISENIINGREISVFKLLNPIVYKNRNIFVIELPAPKSGSYYEEGYEHVEFVIKKSFEDFMNFYNHVNFDTKDLSKKINPDIRIKYGDISVKFHHNSLEYVVRYLE